MPGICSEVTVLPGDEGRGVNQTMDCFSGNFTTLEELCYACEEFRHQEGKHIPILRSVSAIVSIIASMILIWMIRRSHKGLKKDMYHRLLLGLSIADILFSLSQAFFNVAAPYESSYVVWNARGSAMSCDVQGFTRFLGGICVQGYNCSINLFSLAMIKKKTKSEEPVKKLEPYLHGVPIGLAIVISTISVSTQGINASIYGNCWEPVYYLPHCKGVGEPDYEDYEELEENCNRGLDWNSVNWTFQAFFSYAPPIIVLLSLWMIYRTIATQQSKIARYSDFSQNVSSPVSTRSSGTSIANPDIPTTAGVGSSLVTTRSSTSRKLQSSFEDRKRAVRARAVAYSVGYLLTWSGGFVVQAYEIHEENSCPPIFVYFAAIFMPLQGLYNLLIFMHPKVIAEKYRNTNVSWWRAICRAFWSKGKEPRGRRRRLPLRNRQDGESRGADLPTSSTNRRVSFATTEKLSSSTLYRPSCRSSGLSTSVSNIPSKSARREGDPMASINTFDTGSKLSRNGRLSMSLSDKKSLSSSTVISDRSRNLSLSKSLSRKSAILVHFDLPDDEKLSDGSSTADGNGPLDSNSATSIVGGSKENEGDSYHHQNVDDLVDEELIENHFNKYACDVSQVSNCRVSEDFLPAVVQDDDNIIERQKILLLANELAKTNLDKDGSLICDVEEQTSLNVSAHEEHEPMEDDTIIENESLDNGTL